MKRLFLSVFSFALALVSSGQSLDVNMVQDIVSNNINYVRFEDGPALNVKSISSWYNSSNWLLTFDICFDNQKDPTKLGIILYQSDIYAGEYEYYNGDYSQCGDTRIITFRYKEREYLTNYGSLTKDNKPISSFQLGFKEATDAELLVRLLNEANPNNPLEGWWRQEKENERYEGVDSKHLFHIISQDLKTTKITYGDPELVSSSSFAIKYNHPDIIISFVNSPVFSDQWADRGKYTVRFAIKDAIFKNNRPYSSFGGQLVISSQMGIKIQHKGTTVTERSITFNLSQIDCDRFLSEFRVLKRKIIKEGFTGNYQ